MRSELLRQAAGIALLGAMTGGAGAATLPVPCLAGACGTSVGGFVKSGQATAIQSGSKLTVKQGSASAELNWQSFNVSSDGSVQFVQPSASALALNRIYQGNPSQIFGALNANGRVYLINQNGIVFGAGAQVSVGSLLASTLDINAAVLGKGLVAPGLSGQPAFQAFRGANGAALASGAITVEPGASIQTADGGQILLFAPQLSNQGDLSSPGGQTLLGAGSAVYLASSTDPSLRGLLIEVAGNGTVTNGVAANSTASSASQLVGQILAEDGNVTLAGLAVNQLGRVSATTSVNVNGSVRLQARSRTGSSTAVTGGSLSLGASSLTDVGLDLTDPSTAVDSVAQPKSDIQMFGGTIDMLAGSVARATGGSITVAAKQNQGTSLQFQTPVQYLADASRFYMAPGALLDVSGADVVLPASRNVITVQLRGTELADSPLQRNGPLRGQTVYVDLRTGTPLANVSGEIAAIGRTVAERNLTGGTITIDAQGDAILATGAQLDLAGGQIQYTAGYLNTSQLITTAGNLVDIGSASPNVLYTGIANTTTLNNSTWGVTTTSTVLAGNFQPAYVEGKDAGTLNLLTPRFVLDASIDDSTAQGIYQRLPDQAVSAGSLYRPYNQVPQGAILNIGAGSTSGGSDLVAGNLAFAAGPVLPTLRNADGSVFNPLSDPLPASYTSSLLDPAIAGPDAFTTLTLHANGTIMLPAAEMLQLPAGGGLSLEASRIDLEGSVDAPGGTISALAQSTIAPAVAGLQLLVGSNATLTARGEWINDSPLLYPSGNDAPLFVNGGRVSLTAVQSNLLLSPGSLIDVSGGAQFTSVGTLSPGAAGSITLGATTPSGSFAVPNPPQLELGATLRGFGVTRGGSLSVAASGVCIASSDCSAGSAALLWLTPQFFATGGFGSYQVASQQGALSLAAGTSVLLQQRNFQLPASLSALPSDPAGLGGIASYQQLPVQQRAPVNLTLSQSIPAAGFAPGSNDVILAVTATSPDLEIGSGASLLADPGAALSLSSNVRLLVDGTLSAPGGTIALTLNANLPEIHYEPTQAIWLGAQALLSAQGVAQLLPNNAGQLVGSVLPGGSVSLNAQRGSIELLPGSLIDVAGTQAALGVGPAGGDGVYSIEQIGSAGGAVQLTAAESIVLDGAFQAAAGVSGSGLSQPAGGSLAIALSPNSRSDYSLGQNLVSSFSQASRQIVVSPALPAIAIAAPGTAVPAGQLGMAYVPTDVLASTGIDSLTLQSNPIFTAAGTRTGTIQFNGTLSLSADYRITLDAANYVVSPGATAQIQAPYVEFGNSNQSNFARTPATAGTGVLSVSAGFLELYGSSSLQGIGSASFSSTGDLRLRGLTNLSPLNTSLASPSTVIAGGLYADGSVILTGAQIYPASLTQFLISADPGSVGAPTVGSILIQPAAASPGDLLSAGGALTLSAATVTQNGVLRAPFGSITLDAQAIVLGAGSLTSTSAEGLTIPLGTTQGGFDWVYTLPGLATIVYGTDGVAPPAQRVTLNGTQVAIRSGATVDVSGGGDLQAYEWIQGTGGTQDVLSVSVNPNQFAILPALKASVAPYDTQESQNSPLQVGDAVYLSAAPGLAAGTYILLPARYALLPGAFLVSATSGSQYQDIQPGQSFAASGGGTIVSGYRTISGTGFADARTSGFDVVPAAIVLQQAQYNLTSGNQFFAAQAAGAGVPAPALPRDSGALELIARSQLSLDGALRTAPGSGGIGASVDIASANILVSADPNATLQPGQLLLTSASLDQLGAQSLLLGGQRSGASLSTSAQSIEIAGGTTLSAPQLLLSALNQLTVDPGATLAAAGTGPAPVSYQLNGDGAFLDLSAGAQITLTRTGAVNRVGTLTLAAGSTLNVGAGSIYLDATGAVAAQAFLGIAGGDLAVQSGGIALGAAPANYGGTVLSASVLGASGLRNLLLVGSGGIDFYGSVAASAQNVTLDTPVLIGHGAAGDVAAISASGTLALRNSSGAIGSTAASGDGALVLSAGTMTVGSGAVSAAGFQSVALDAQGALNGLGSGGLALGAGALRVSASQIDVAAGGSLSLSAAGAVSLLSPATPASLVPITDLGGALTVSGASVEVGTRIELPSGSVTLLSIDTVPADAGIMLDAGAAIGVAGLLRSYDGVMVASPGGTVTFNSAGNVTLLGGSTIDVSAGSGGVGGALQITASALGAGLVSLAGTLTGTAATGQGASFLIDAQGFGDFGALNQALNAGGFNGTRSFRLRGPGDLVVAAGTASSITATNVLLEADQGDISVQGLIDASGVAGGTVLLSAAGDLTLTGTIDAHATSTGQNGGRVELETQQGRMLLQAGSLIDVSGGGALAGGAGTGGTVLLRVPRSTVSALLGGGSGVALAGGIDGSTRTTLEAYQVYQVAGGSLPAADLTPGSSPWFAAAQTFMGANNANATAIRAALGRSGDASFVIEPGVEIDTTGSLSLDSTWDLYPWRFTDAAGNAVPGVLTLRAAGSITFNASLTDGFDASVDPFNLPPTPTDSWSYRIVAGADLGAPNPLALAAATASPANVTIAACTASACSPYSYSPNMVRTGDGFIDVSASGNLVLGNQDSLLYTAGVAGPGLPLVTFTGGGLIGQAFPVDGGDIRVAVGGNVIGAPSNQFVNAWLWRQGGEGIPTAWTVDFLSFQQGIGALGGGNVSISAGGNIQNLSVSIPSIGAQVGCDYDSSCSIVQVEGGGQLSVSAGGSILGGSYYADLGNLALRSGTNIGSLAVSAGGTGIAPLLGLGSGSATVLARGNLQLAGIVNPTLLASGNFEGNAPDFFSTYGASSSVSLTAVGGDIVLNDQNAALSNQLGASFSSFSTNNAGDGYPVGLDVLPPTLDAAALSGNIDIGRLLIISPAANGNLQLFADHSVNGTTTSSGSMQLLLSDADPALLPSIAAPQLDTQIYLDVANALGQLLPDQHAAVPVHLQGAVPDSVPVRIVARTGDVVMPASVGGGGAAIWSSKPVQVVAGRDIVDPTLIAQNLLPSDVTSLSAGRNIVYPQSRLTNGSIAPNVDQIAVDGPGSLQLSAEGNVNLGTSAGITTRGNLINTALPVGGAQVSIDAGLGGGAAQYAAFISQYLVGSSDFDAQLAAFVQNTTGLNGLDAARAKQDFLALSASLQREFVEQVYFDLLRQYGRQAAASGSGDFSGAFAAIQTLFPGANPNLLLSQTNPYQGNIELYFSRVYTLEGGDISLLAPGGEINVGLALVPASYGINKGAAQLGLVAQSSGDINAFAYNDFQVNQSRVFAADGGNILVWSTEGNIDAGRGAKTAISAPPPTITINAQTGQLVLTFSNALTGSGIQALATSPGVSPGDVDLFAPHGVVNANDAGIVAGNLTIAATAVLGTSNITVSGSETGVPVVVSGLSAGAAGAASSGASTTNTAESAANAQRTAQSQTPAADAAISFLEVFVTGLGEENCRPDDLECLRRQKKD